MVGRQQVRQFSLLVYKNTDSKRSEQPSIFHGDVSCGGARRNYVLPGLANGILLTVSCQQVLYWFSAHEIPIEEQDR
jgi:hypothetical protein